MIGSSEFHDLAVQVESSKACLADLDFRNSVRVKHLDLAAEKFKEADGDRIGSEL